MGTDLPGGPNARDQIGCRGDTSGLGGVQAGLSLALT